ncbi:MAG: glycosyltransferase family 39 protein [Bacteroidales bacterium]|nr:glycosyltransferase family 39 protein [Bacteroidales bacterium]MCF8398241.1 glycosyltransferase family 39 protein [Bacteroidales bacterium]
MISDWIRTNRIYVILAISVVSFVILKIPDLKLPFYWDEAWPFSHAIFKLYEHGLSFSPDAIPTEISRGHPILFHFLTVIWMNIFGTSLLAMNSFPLFLSVILLLAVFFVGKGLFNKETGLIATLLLGFQAVFVAQASFLLLEVQLSLFLLLMFYFHIKRKYIWFVLFGAAAILTKETAVFGIITLMIWEFARLFFPKAYSSNFKQFLLRELILIIPVAIASIYYISQKFIHGWLFFPTHVDFISWEFQDIREKLWVSIGFIFFEQGRYLITLLLILILAFRYYFLRKKFERKNWEVTQLFMLFIILFIILSSINFLSDRYLLCTLPFFLLVFAYALQDTFQFKPFFTVFGTLIIIAILADFLTQTENTQDSTLGYRDQVEVHRQMVEYCEEQNLYDKDIYTHFLMQVNLTSPYAGYLSDTSKRFTRVSDQFNQDTDYCIFSNIEYSPEFSRIRKWYNLELEKKFRENLAWVELFKVKPTTTEQDSVMQVKFSKLVERFIQEIKNKDEWLESIRLKALREGVPLDTMIRRDAVYMASQEMEEK